MDALRDFSMLMFKGADSWNRYITGGAAMVRWQDAMRKLGISFKQSKLSTRQVTALSKKGGAAGRNPWVRKEIEEALGRGDLMEAQTLFVKDVVADTQFLYGAVDTPVASQVLGTPGKAAAVFQTWWMNYGTALGKWLRTGTTDEKTLRMFNWMLSSYIGYLLMEQMWGARTASATSFLGPFPQVGEGLPIPPAFKPIQQLLATVFRMGEVAVGAQPPEKIATQVRALGRATFSFLPGGLQIQSLVRAGEKEGLKGVLGEVIRYRGGE